MEWALRNFDKTRKRGHKGKSKRQRFLKGGFDHLNPSWRNMMIQRWISLLCGTAFAVMLATTLAGCPGGTNTENTNADGGDGGTSGCTSNAQCKTDEVCDTTAGMCFKNCKDASFKDCDPGNKCDDTLSRCVCDATACAKEGATYACHPFKRTCVIKCADNTQCTGGEECRDSFCLKPGQQLDECKGDPDCAGKAPNTTCDTAASPKKCVPPPRECTADPECKDKLGKVCSTAGKCVECVSDQNCNGKKCNTTTNVCEGPAACTTTAVCHEAAKKTYCPDDSKTAGCQAVPNEACDANATGNEGWAIGIETSKGNIIHDVKINHITSDACWSADSNRTECTATSDCPNGYDCRPFDANKSLCGKDNANGTVEVSFSYYNKSGSIDTKRASITTHKGEGAIAGNPSITTDPSNKVDGKIKFTICLDNRDKSHGFYTSDANGDPSNRLCYTAQ